LYDGRKYCFYDREVIMAKTKKTRSKSGAKKASAGKRSAGRKKARVAAPAANRRVIELEAENRRLREEIAALRAEREERGDAIASDGPPTLEL
jgi:basic region leucine zipper protein